MTRSFALSGDLATPYVVVACALAALGLVLLVIELWRSRSATGASGGEPSRGAFLVVLSGLVATAALLAAVLRPVSVVSKGSLVGPRVVVLLDASRSIDLPGLSGTRRQTLEGVMRELDQRGSDVRLSKLAFGQGRPAPIANARPGEGEAAPPAPAAPPLSFDVQPMAHSDLGAALQALAAAADERPAAIVVVSDGRLDRPGETGTKESTVASLGALSIPVHTVALATAPPPDASIRLVKAAGAAVAHQPFSLQIEIGCDGGVTCDDVPVAARELREEGDPTQLASGTAHVSGGKGLVELPVTLDRAGSRILEVSLKPPSGDTIPENDRRYVTIDVTRDRVRVLHVAGRPTYDVRALRMWLKADASVDVIAFFILRTLTDDVNATADELALIPFPVDELFSEHLPSFDAVVLQDFNAAPYGLTKHLKSLARYVDKGGGLIMVGGPDAFVGGHYAGTPLADVLPVDLKEDPDAAPSGSDLGRFVPRLTEAGRAAPVLAPLGALIGDEMPEMPGTNLVGDAKPGADVLLEHPTLKTPSGKPMPVLALGEHGSGRTIALTVDGSHRLLFSNFAASAAGRAHGAFWDAMLGWLMRDPRFEPAALDLPDGCFAGEATTLRLRPRPGAKGPAIVKIARLGTGQEVVSVPVVVGDGESGTPVPVGRLEAGGYSATVEIGGPDGKAPSTRRDFACEKGGDEWADTRPDVARLQAIAEATGGKSVLAGDVASLPLPEATQIASERQVAPLLPPWAWTLSAAMALGAHWIVRRRGGLT